MPVLSFPPAEPVVQHLVSRQGEQRCLTHELWCELSQQIYDFLSNINLAQLVERRGIREVANRQDQLVPGQDVSLREPDQMLRAEAS